MSRKEIAKYRGQWYIEYDMLKKHGACDSQKRLFLRFLRARGYDKNSAVVVTEQLLREAYDAGLSMYWLRYRVQDATGMYAEMEAYYDLIRWGNPAKNGRGLSLIDATVKYFKHFGYI